MMKINILHILFPFSFPSSVVAFKHVGCLPSLQPHYQLQIVSSYSTKRNTQLQAKSSSSSSSSVKVKTTKTTKSSSSTKSVKKSSKSLIAEDSTQDDDLQLEEEDDDTSTPHSSSSSISQNKILVIVESPSKARTIQKFLDSNKYIVDSSMGHVRDLVKSSKTLPDKYKKMVVSQTLGLKASGLGIDVYNDFQPIYDILVNKVDIIKRFKSYLKSCQSIILATDEDREGEAISWHLLETIQPKIPYKRAVFHEISKTAILDSFQNLRDIDMHLVQSQETRRVLDRLAGYTLSPVLWRYVSE